jgi:ABC-type transporter Mla maintaining outer membrane lipid asymmetry ATPase subunit MlaF
MNSLLKIEDLTKSFGDKIIFKDITLEIFSGDVISVI